MWDFPAAVPYRLFFCLPPFCSWSSRSSTCMGKNVHLWDSCFARSLRLWMTDDLNDATLNHLIHLPYCARPQPGLSANLSGYLIHIALRQLVWSAPPSALQVSYFCFWHGMHFSSYWQQEMWNRLEIDLDQNQCYFIHLNPLYLWLLVLSIVNDSYPSAILVPTLLKLDSF